MFCHIKLITAADWRSLCRVYYFIMEVCVLCCTVGATYSLLGPHLIILYRYTHAFFMTTNNSVGCNWVCCSVRDVCTIWGDDVSIATETGYINNVNCTKYVTYNMSNVRYFSDTIE
jgi:hypothetical protein